MEAITNFFYAVDDFMWGSWMTVLILVTGILLSVRFGFRYQTKLVFNFKNTFAKIRSGGEGEGSISGFRAACTALANTVGTGNISGVATAIVSGGPGALVWMWISAFFGMSTKACEIIIGQRYREHYKESMDEYVCDRSFVLKNAFGKITGKDKSNETSLIEEFIYPKYGPGQLWETVAEEICAMLYRFAAEYGTLTKETIELIDSILPAIIYRDLPHQTFKFHNVSQFNNHPGTVINHTEEE